MANCVKCRFSLKLQLFSVVLKSAPVKYIATYCPWDSHQIHSSCTSMSLWWQNNPSLWLSWTISIPKWVSIFWHAACAPSNAKLLEGGVYILPTIYLIDHAHAIDSVLFPNNANHRPFYWRAIMLPSTFYENPYVISQYVEQWNVLCWPMQRRTWRQEY